MKAMWLELLRWKASLKMRSKTNGFVLDVNRRIEACENLCFVARDSQLQADACTELAQLIKEIGEEKKIAISKQDEDYANCLLGCECAAHAIFCELRMWLLLKQEKPEEAWDELINEQHALRAAMRAHRGFSHLSVPIRRSIAIEELIFPPQMFMSSGFIVRKQICTICGGDYDDCEHLAGMPYMGRFCAIRPELLEVDHVAIVDVPADKRCRIVTFETEGGVRNRMTWKVEPKSSEVDQSSPGEGLKATAIIVRSD